MRITLAALLLTTAALSLSACTGSQTGKALNAFDSKSHWTTDYSEPLHSNSFWYSGYSEEELNKHKNESGWFAGHTDSGSTD